MASANVEVVQVFLNWGLESITVTSHVGCWQLGQTHRFRAVWCWLLQYRLAWYDTWWKGCGEKLAKGNLFTLSLSSTDVKNWFRSEAFIWSYPLFHGLEWIVGQGEHLLKQLLFPTLIWVFESVSCIISDLILRFFLLCSECNVFIGNASHRLWWEGMLPVFRK